MTDESAFQAALDASPSSSSTRLVFADWLEEQGDDRAAGYRWMGENEKWPHTIAGPSKIVPQPRGILTMPKIVPSNPWYWTTVGGLQEMLPHAGLPYWLSARIGFGEWRGYVSRQDAELAVCEVIADFNPIPEWCKACGIGPSMTGDEYGRCSECIKDQLVPTRRGGFRRLGVYDG